MLSYYDRAIMPGKLETTMLNGSMEYVGGIQGFQAMLYCPHGSPFAPAPATLRRQPGVMLRMVRPRTMFDCRIICDPNLTMPAWEDDSYYDFIAMSDRRYDLEHQ